MATAEPSFRPVREADQAFLLRLYAANRAAELSRSSWPGEAISAFLAQQFDLQQRHYQVHYPDAECWLIEHAGQPIGRFTLLWGESALRIIEIALLPDYHGGGLGTALLGDVLERADARGLATELHVEHFNPAQRLYRRLGFQVVGEDGVYLTMRRPAAEPDARGHPARGAMFLREKAAVSVE